MADEIKIRIGLEGDADIKKKLDGIRDNGKKFGDEISKSINQSVQTNPALGKAFGAEEGMERGRIAAERFRETIHALHPLLGAAGLEIGGLGAYARLAGAGFATLGAVIVGSVLIGLAKISDEADKAKRRLDILTGAGKGGGASQAEHLNDAAKQLGVLPSDIAPAAETLFKYQRNITAQNRNVIHPDNFVAGANEEAASKVQIAGPNQSYPGGAPSNETVITALKAAVEAGRIDRSTPKEASSAFNDFFESTNKGKGLVTVEALDQLIKASPALADAVAKGASGTGVGGVGQTFADTAAYRKFIAQGGQQTGGAALAGLARVEPDIRDQAAKVPVNLTEALGRVEAKSHGLAEELGNATMRAAKFLNETPGQIYDDAKKSGALPSPEAGQSLTRSLNPLPAPYTTPTSPLDRITPTPAAPTNGPRSDASGIGQPQQLASLSENFQAFIESVNAALSRADKRNLDLSGQPVEAVGVRGATGGHIVRMAEGGQARLNVSPGGHLSGPGTGTSDSIPADVANGEFVVNAKDTAKNLELLHDINSGKVSGGHYAAGGFVQHFAKGGFADFLGDMSVTYDPDTGGAYINGSLVLPGNPILDDPRIQAAIERSKASMNDSSSNRTGQFGQAGGYSGGEAYGNADRAGGYASGGLVGGGGGRGSFMSRLSAMGFASGGFIDVPHLAVGGMPDHSPILSESSSAFSAPGGSNGGADLSHFGTVDLRTNHGDFRVMSHEDTLRHMNTAAVEAKTFSTGKKPAWYGSGA